MNRYQKQALALVQLISNKQCAVFAGNVGNGICLLSAENDETACIEIHDERFYQSVLGGSVAVARAYINGWWDSPDLYALMHLVAKNIDSVNARMDSGWRRLPRLLIETISTIQRQLQSRKSAQSDIAAHYDLGNDFFSLFLDETLAYSCAVFPDLQNANSQTLAQSSKNKLQKISEKLELTEKDSFLDLGCGWGSMSFYAAAQTQCAVTALTLSKAQHRYVSDHAKHTQVQAVLSDYRDFKPQQSFNKLSSVEMIEAVGEKHFQEYFRRIRYFLTARGTAVIQAILIPDARYRTARREADFIREYVFPGGMLPSPHIINNAVANADLQVVESEDISAHYAPTLLAWRERFNHNRARVRALGFSESFCRVWEYYFCYCAGSFSAGAINAAQITLSVRK